MAYQYKLRLRIPPGGEQRPFRKAQKAAVEFAAEHGRSLNNDQFKSLYAVQKNPRTSLAISNEYAKAEQTGITDTPELRSSYDALHRDVEKHYNKMVAPKEQGGLGMTVEVVEHDPYGGNRHQFMDSLYKDLRKGHLKVESTASTGGHAYVTNEQNDKFRAVHDFYGHGAIGRGLSRHGEDAAWRLHSMMVSPEAHPALAAELRAQNDYFINRGSFPSQADRIVGLPDWAHQFNEPNLTPKQKKPKKPEPDRLPGIDW